MKNPRYDYDPFLESEQGGGVAVQGNDDYGISLINSSRDTVTGNTCQLERQPVKQPVRQLVPMSYPALTDVQRIARHYGISVEEACEWLKHHTVDELLPERGTGAETGTRRTVLLKAVASPYEVIDDYYGSLATVGYAGKITKMELEYDGVRSAIPVTNVPAGTEGLVHVYVRNDTTTAQRLGIWWEVKDPDGVVKETYAAWEAWPYTGAGGTHQFIGGRFSLDKGGTWTISIQAFMGA